MQRCDVICWMAGGFVALLLGGLPLPAAAQITRGFDTTAAAIASGEERQRQPDLYLHEVQFKSMRMAYVNITDPVTGETERQQVWYLAYRAVNRSLMTRADETDTTPVNVLDRLPGPTYLTPEFQLLTYEQPDSDIPLSEYPDEIIPEATAVINQIERRRPSDPIFLDSVSIMQPLSEPVPAEQTDIDWIYGVALWRNVDPETDFFTVVMRGFSNGYELRSGPDGEPVAWRKAIVQRFTRRGDRFDPNQIEFEHDGPPQWVYLPDPPPGG